MDIIIDLQSSDTQRIQLTIAITFTSSEDTEEEHVMHSTNDNIKFSPCNDANEVVNEPFESLHSKYPDNLETSMRGSNFIFDSVEHMYYKYHKVNFNHCGSYIDSPDWIKNKKATINPKNEDDKCFQYAVTVALNYEEIKCNPERVSNIKPFINIIGKEYIIHQKLMFGKSLKKIIQQLLLIFCILKKKKHFLLIFQKITQPMKNKQFS